MHTSLFTMRIAWFCSRLSIFWGSSHFCCRWNTCQFHRGKSRIRSWASTLIFGKKPLQKDRYRVTLYTSNQTLQSTASQIIMACSTQQSSMLISLLKLLQLLNQYKHPETKSMNIQVFRTRLIFVCVSILIDGCFKYSCRNVITLVKD